MRLSLARLRECATDSRLFGSILDMLDVWRLILIRWRLFGGGELEIKAKDFNVPLGAWTNVYEDFPNEVVNEILRGRGTFWFQTEGIGIIRIEKWKCKYGK